MRKLIAVLVTVILLMAGVASASVQMGGGGTGWLNLSDCTGVLTSSPA